MAEAGARTSAPAWRSIAARSRCSRRRSSSATALDAPDRKAALFQFEVPADAFTPGLYTCQINVIDAVAGQVRVSAARDAGEVRRQRRQASTVQDSQETLLKCALGALGGWRLASLSLDDSDSHSPTSCRPCARAPRRSRCDIPASAPRPGACPSDSCSVMLPASGDCHDLAVDDHFGVERLHAHGQRAVLIGLSGRRLIGASRAAAGTGSPGWRG